MRTLWTYGLQGGEHYHHGLYIFLIKKTLYLWPLVSLFCSSVSLYPISLISVSIIFLIHLYSLASTHFPDLAVSTFDWFPLPCYVFYCKRERFFMKYFNAH